MDIREMMILIELNSNKNTITITGVYQGIGQPYLVITDLNAIKKIKNLKTPSSTNQVTVTAMNGDWDSQSIQIIATSWQSENCIAFLSENLGTGRLIRINYTIAVTC